MCIADVTMSVSRAQCLRPIEMAQPALVQGPVFWNNWIVYIETINPSFLHSNDCSLKLISYRDILPGLAKLASFFGCIQQTHLIDLEVENKKC